MTLPETWSEILKFEISKPYFTELSNKIEAMYQSKDVELFPAYNQVFRAFELCSPDDLKVVILGQDPYPTKGHAHGLCFSVEPTVKPFPKSLNNIFKEIENDLNQPFPENGNLERWAKQGVLLLNSVLTVEEGRADSHKGMGWEQFTDSVIKVINQEKEHVVFLLWGSKAIAKADFIDSSKHFVLTAVHPSPLSAYRGFFGCQHFSKTNEYLSSKNRNAIDW